MSGLRYAYDAAATSTTQLGACQLSAALRKGYKFTGKERDSESSLDNFGARYNASSMGRFMTPDRPFADQKPRDQQSWNLYSYVTNNPLRFVDPTGTVKRGATGQIHLYATRQTGQELHERWFIAKGTMQPGYFQADNGKKIEAFQQVGGSSAYKCDCHGLTFADGKVLGQQRSGQQVA